MTVFEMHISLNQRIQEIASYKRDKLRPEEIDLVLNKAMDRLLQKGVDTGFEDDQISLSHVAALLQKNKVAEVIKPAISDPQYEENNPNVYHVLPPDFLYLANARAEVVTNIFDCEQTPELESTTTTEHVTSIAFPGPNTAPYYSGTTVVSSTLGGLYALPSGISAGFGSPNSKYVVINNIIEQSYRRNPNIKVYWERYRDVYRQNYFFFVSNVSLGTITITTGGFATTSSTVATNYPIYNRAAIDSTTQRVKLAPVKVLEADMQYQAKQNEFYDTNEQEVNAAQTHDYLILYEGESFIVTRLYYDYIRKPRTISLVLNQSCELASSTHNKIIDLAVEILRMDTKDESYQITVQDTQLRT